MVRVKLLLAAAGLVLCSVALGQPAIADNPGCSSAMAFAGLCEPPSASGEFGHGGVDLSAGYETGGGGGQNEGDNGDNGSNGSAGDLVGGGGVGVGGAGAVIGANPAPIIRDGFTINCTPGTPCDPSLVVLISDLVNFTPAVPTQGMEPAGWTVVGLPTNFFAVASVHIRSGLLLGFPADVRFTPVGYRWNYGDGSSARLATGGASWAALGLAEFSETATSHLYGIRSTVTIASAVDYGAEYRFAGQPWRAINGTIAVWARPLTAIAGDAETVLVERDCLRGPRGPGC
jgi:hypothetical protein